MKLLLCYPVDDGQIQQIRQIVPDWKIVSADQDNVANLLPECDVFCGHARVPVDWQTVVDAGRLQWIQSSAAGLDHCLTSSVIESDIQVSSCSGLFRDSVAEQTMALLYGLIRSLPVFFRAQQRHDYTRHPTNDLHGSVAGIVGFGGNGQRICDLLRPAVRRIIATDRIPDLWSRTPGISLPDELLPSDQLSSLLAQCNVVISTLPLDKTTLRIFGENEFGLMPRGGWFVNVGRGGLVDEDAMLAALNSGQLAGAGIDVAFTEPLPVDSPLWDHPNVIITPHVGAQSARRHQLVTDLFCRNLKRFLLGESPYNLVDKRIGIPVPNARFYG